MSILATDNKLISFGTDYSAGSGISIIDHTISIVPSAVGKTYSAGPNIGIYDVSGQPTISSKDWSNEISDASAGAVTQSTSYFNDWINGQYTGDITNITNNITALSGDLSSYYKKTETSSKKQISDALQYVSANAGKVYKGVSPIVVNNDENKVSADTWTLIAGDGISFTENSANKVTRIDVTAQGGDEGVNSFVHNNSATILDVNSSYQANSGNFLTAIPSDVATTGDVANLEQTISETYYPKSNPSSFATESWVNGQGFLTAHQDISNKLDSSAFSSVSGDFLTTSFSIPESATWNDTSNVVQTNSAQWAEVSAKVDTTALIPTIDSNTISYSGKPTDEPIYASGNDLNNVGSIQGKSSLAIVPSGVLQVPNVITATNGVIQVPNAITSTNGNLIVPNIITAAQNNGLQVQNAITANTNGITANGLSAHTNYGLTANGLTADASKSGFSAIGISAGKQGPFIIQGSHESISSNNEVGFIFSSDNSNFNSATLTTAQGNSLVQMAAPKFEAKNISGAGFSIEASGAKGYDESGNVVWDTHNPQVKNIISYSDTKTAQGGLNGNIILTTMPSTNANNLTSSPYVIMDANQASYFAAYGPSAQTPTVSIMPSQITFAYPVGNSGRTTVGYTDIKQECSGSSWTLTGSIQKRELEYDSSTSAITAINGSALAGQGGGSTFDPTYMSAQIDNKLYFSAVGFRKVNSIDYVSGISGKDISAKYAGRATTALNSDHANTASYDDNGNSLTTTYYNAQEANTKANDLFNFVQSNSANWGGGSSTAVDNKVLFYKNYSYDPSNGSQSIDTFVSGATELYFEAAVDSQQSIPSEIVIYRNGNEIGRAYWSQVSSDGNYNYLTASYNNADGGDIQIQNNNGTNYSNFDVSANGVKTLVFYQDSFDCETDKEVKFNVNGFNIVGQINGWLQGNITPLTSFTGGLTDFTAKGYDKYDTNINYEDSNNSYNYLVSAEFGGNGSTQQEVSHDNTLSGNGVADSPLGVILSATNDANVNNIIVTASLPSTPNANTLYLIPEA